MGTIMLTKFGRKPTCACASESPDRGWRCLDHLAGRNGMSDSIPDLEAYMPRRGQLKTDYSAMLWLAHQGGALVRLAPLRAWSS